MMISKAKPYIFMSRMVRNADPLHKKGGMSLSKEHAYDRHFFSCLYVRICFSIVVVALYDRLIFILLLCGVHPRRKLTKLNLTK